METISVQEYKKITAKDGSAKPKKIMHEHREQVALFEWWKVSGLAARYLMFSIPNGGKRGARAGNWMVAEGLTAGVPDIFLAYVNKFYGGLFIELKRPGKTKADPAQRKIMERLKAYGYQVALCDGYEKAKEAILLYLDEGKHD